MRAPEDLNILPGMTATVTMTYRRASILGDRLTVPITAVHYEDGGQPIAWVIGAENKVERRPISVGEARGSEVEVVDGLVPGDRIAVAGVTRLREGMTVRDLGGALGEERP